MGYLLRIIQDFTRIYVWNVLRFLNHHLLKTYSLIEDCARCRDCGRNVHDFLVPTWLWVRVWGNEGGILCYDCFCDRTDKIYRWKWRIDYRGKWRIPNVLGLLLDDMEEC